jgi:hypothetical protein
LVIKPDVKKATVGSAFVVPGDAKLALTTDTVGAAALTRVLVVALFGPVEFETVIVTL